MSNFGQLQTKVLAQFKSQDDELRQRVKQAINDTIFEINSEIPKGKHLEATDSTITLTSGTSTVTNGIPSDFDHQISLFLLDSNNKRKSPLIYLDRKKWNEERLVDWSDSLPQAYTIWANVLYVGPKPDQSYSAVLDYYSFDSELTSDAASSKISTFYPRWENVIFRGACAKIHEYLQADDSAISRTFAEYNLYKKIFKKWVNEDMDKSPESSRIKGWKERQGNNSILPHFARRI